MTVETLFEQISDGEVPSWDSFRPGLQASAVSERVAFCHQVLRALLKSRDEKFKNLAGIIALRLWNLSGHAEFTVSEVVEAFAWQENIERVRSCYKELGLRFVREGNIDRAIHYFDLWQNAFCHFLRVDRFEYDREVLAAVDTLASPFQFYPYQNWNFTEPRQLRIAYLIHDLSSIGSVLVKIQLLMIKNHNRENFQVIVCVLSPKSSVEASEIGARNLRLLEAEGCEFVFASEESTLEKSLLEFAKNIFQARPDILFTSAAIASFKNYFICAARPAPIVIAQLQGPHAQYVAPWFDRAIAWLPQLISDCPVDCSQVNLELELKKTERDVAAEKVELGYQPTDRVIFCGGRLQKFQDQNFWRAIGRVLTLSPNARFLAVGVTKDSIKFIDEVVPSEAVGRIEFLGWQRDYKKFLMASDVVVDTYPSGGGVLLFEVMAMGVPFIGFENDELKIFSQVDWSAIYGHVKNKRLMLPRENWELFVATLLELISGAPKFAEVARENRDHVLSENSCPKRMTRKIEEIFLQEARKVSQEKRLSYSRASSFGDEDNVQRLRSRVAQLESDLKTDLRAVSLKIEEGRLSEKEAKQIEIEKYLRLKELELTEKWKEFNSVSELTAIGAQISGRQLVSLLLKKIADYFKFS